MKKDERAPTQRQLATLERRKHIVEAAAICFIEQGFHQTSIRDIAKRAGISLGNLYNHFESKTALIGEIAGLEADDLAVIRAALDQDAPALQRIDAFVIAAFDYAADPGNAVLAAEITAEAMRSPQIVEAFSDNRRKTVDALVETLKADAVALPEPVEDLAQTLLDLIESSAVRVAFDTKKAKTSARGTLRSVVQRLLVSTASNGRGRS